METSVVHVEKVNAVTSLCVPLLDRPQLVPRPWTRPPPMHPHHSSHTHAHTHPLSARLRAAGSGPTVHSDCASAQCDNSGGGRSGVRHRVREVDDVTTVPCRLYVHGRTPMTRGHTVRTLTPVLSHVQLVQMPERRRRVGRAGCADSTRACVPHQQGASQGLDPTVA
jgi:hypothetical protein